MEREEVRVRGGERPSLVILFETLIEHLLA